MEPAPATSLPEPAAAELRLSLERAHRESAALDRLAGIWGLLLAKCCLAQAAIERWSLPLDGWIVVWSGSLALAALASLLYLRSHLGSLARVPAGFRVSTVLALALLIVALGAAHAAVARGLLGPVALGALVSGLVGAHALVVAALRHRAEPLLGALLAWAAAAVGLGAGRPDQALLWTGAAFLGGLALPFLAMARFPGRARA